jgi:hypothetical protein
MYGVVTFGSSKNTVMRLINFFSALPGTRCLILFLVAMFSSALAIAQCTAPTNQPTALVIPKDKITATTIQVDFTAAAAGASNATHYLIVASTDGTAPQNPANNQTYNQDDPLGNDRVVFFGPATSVVVQHLDPNTDYTFYVYAANAGPCYNTTNPLTGTAKTSEQGTIAKSDSGSTSSKLDALLNFNFVGNQNGWSNLTPIVFYGWTISGMAYRKDKEAKAADGNKVKHRLFGNAVQIGPYVGSTIAIKDSSSYLPALMLPGNAGVEVNYFMTFGNEKKFSVVFCPINFGLKVISGYTDSSVSLVQHNIRHALGIRYGDYFTLSAQYTTGWHNATSHSEENYNKLFPNVTDKVRYWNVTLNTRLSENLFGGTTNSSPLYLSLNWRSMVDASNLGNFPNSRFITVGIITNIDLKSGANPGMVPRVPQF